MPELREEELDQLFQQAILLHPSEDELGLFHDGAVDEVTSAQITAHLRQCADCRESFETMRHILATYHEVEVPPVNIEQLKALIASTRPATDKSAALAALIGLTLYALDAQSRRQKIRFGRRGAQAAEKLFCRGKTDDDLLSWRLEEDDFGDIKVAFASPRLDLEDYRLAISIGGVIKETSLKRLSAEKLGCVLTISREENNRLSEGDQLVIKSLEPPLSLPGDG